MNINDVKIVVENEIAKMDDFDNWHGITKENLSKFLVDPYEVMVDPDDGGETDPRLMRVILHERPDPKEGYLIAYDCLNNTWAVLENTSNAVYPFVQIIGGDSLVEMLNGM